jgi:3-oxoacyl-[acyl-carrier-protein] synthase II
MRRVVVTGLGAVTPIGNTAPAFWRQLIVGTSGAAAITRFDTSRLKTTFACEVKDFDPYALLSKTAADKNDLFSQYALVAAIEAMQQAGLDMSQADASRMGTIIGVANGGSGIYQQELLNYHTTTGAARFQPYFIPKMMANMTTSAVSMHFGLKGICYSVSTACSSGNTAIMDAFNYIRWGEADVMICGGADAPIFPFAIGGFNAMRALSVQNAHPERASRPFDVSRDGFVLGEGSGLLVLEAYDHAVKRGAPILAELAGTGMTADSFHISTPHPEGEGAARAMRLALRQAGIAAEEVDYLNAHSTSTPLGDLAEIQAIRQVFGDRPTRLQISATKSGTGHLLGAAAGIEAIASILAIQDQIIPPTINLEVLDPAIPPDFPIVKNTAKKHPIEIAMSNSFGFGGHNCTVIFKKWVPDL